MARRKSRGTAAPVLPPELAEFRVEDWTGPEDVPDESWFGGTVERTTAQWLAVTAWERYQAARWRWKQENNRSTERGPLWPSS